MTERPYILLDPRQGSADLRPFLQALGAHVDMSQQIAADFAFAGYGPDGIMLVGGEYKLTGTGDIFKSMTDGRLTGTQIPALTRNFERRYLVIEGLTRMAVDGGLEHSPTRSGGDLVWQREHGMDAHQYWSRLESIAEFWGVAVKETYDKKATAGWIVSAWRYWNKPYAEHASHRAWDRSADVRRGPSAGFAVSEFGTTSELPIVQRMAAEIDGIGQGHSGYVAKYFATPAEMLLGKALADVLKADPQVAAKFAEDWRAVECLQKLKKAAGYRRIHFSKERVAKIWAQLWGIE